MRPVPTLRLVSALEGVSYLLLLGIAMPLKYLFDQPLAVQIAGAGHGWLFVTFCAALAWATFARRWSVLRAGLLFGLSLVPLGFLVIDRMLRDEGQEESAAAAA